MVKDLQPRATLNSPQTSCGIAKPSAERRSGSFPSRSPFKSIAAWSFQTEAAWLSLRDEFLKSDFVRIPSLLNSDGQEMLTKEVLRLVPFMKRRCVIIEHKSISALRKMSTIGARDIRRHSSVIQSLYFCPWLRRMLELAINEPIFPIPDTNEDFVINRLTEPGDLHGAHVDTYEFSLILLVEMPKLGGGKLKYYRLGPTKDPGEIKSPELHVGDSYLFRADRNVHWVDPIQRAEARTVLNFTFTSSDCPSELSFSSSAIYG